MPKSSTGRGSLELNVYVVYVPVKFQNRGRANRKAICARLNNKAAQTIASSIPEAYVEKLKAGKSPDLTRTEQDRL